MDDTMRPTTYEYRVMPVSAVVLLCDARAGMQPDAYVSDDEGSRALRALLSNGYRWVRTDGEWAIFERARN